MPTISVIVPIFNNEDTLETCVGSILAQTHDDFDVILVDDGSEDMSGAMCDAYAECDPRVRVLHSANRGVAAARNLGVDCALSNGAQFIFFVDADDWLGSRMLENLYRELECAGADMAVGGVRIHGFRTTSERIPTPALYDRAEALRAHAGGAISNFIWGKLYRRNVFEDLRFPEGRVFEDLAIVYRIVLRCEKVISVPYVGYHYVMREGSLGHTHTMSHLADSWTAYKERYEYFIEKEPELLDAEIHAWLVRGLADAVCKMWRWAYENDPRDRAAYSNMIREMRDCARGVVRDADKSGWPFHQRATLVFARSDSAASLAAVYFTMQAYLRLFPKKTGTRR